MPSPEHAADLERLLTRAAKECEGVVAWFGTGLPHQLRRALEASGRAFDDGTPEVAFVDARELASGTPSKIGVCRIVALSDAAPSELPGLLRAADASSVAVARMICPFGVFDFVREGLRVREVRRGLTAADLQNVLDTPLWAGPDLKEMGAG